MDTDPLLDMEVLLAHAPFVRATARALLRGDSRAEDVVQDTFLVALERGPRRRASARSWLVGVVRNLVFTVRRRDSARLKRERAAARSAELPSAAEIHEREESRRSMVMAVLALREPYRSAILLRYYEDLPPREIGRRLGVPAETARTRVKRGLALLRDRLDGENGGDRARWASALAPILGTAGGATRAAGVTATKVAGGIAMGSSVKVGIGVVVIVLLCVGASVLFLGPVEEAAPPDGKPEQTAAGGARPPRPGRIEESDDRPLESGGVPRPDDASAAPETPPETPGPPPGTWRAGPARTVKGSVTAQDSGQPVVGVKVLIECVRRSGGKAPKDGEPRITAETDAEGAFHFEGLEPGTYRIAFSHPLYAHRAVSGIRISDQSGIQGIAVPLIGDPDRFGAIEGRVVDPDAVPLEGRTVVVHSQSGHVRVEATSDDDGFYRVERLTAGWYRISLLAPGETDLWQRMQIANVVPRESSRVDFWGTGTLTGVVVDSEEDPVPEVTVEIIPVDFGAEYRQRVADTGPDGKFRIENAGVGHHHLRVNARKEGWSIRVETVNLSGYDQEVRVRLPQGQIAGTILLAEEGVPPAKKRLNPGFLLHPALPDQPGEYGSHIANAFSDWNGKFAFKAVSPGRYRITVHLDGYFEVAKDVEVDFGPGITDLALVLRKMRLGTLKIRVKDHAGKPVEGVIISYGRPGGEWRGTRAEQPEPGLYMATKIEAGTWTLAFGRKDLKMKTVKATVTEGETTEVEVQMEPK
ncbi:MAG: sigma-70 family RNA polymerase sigma factor [Planctomycetota bacterium]